MLSFSENLKRYRKEAGISQEELAAHMGITAQAVSKWECGLSYPDITLIIPLSELFGITADELLRGIGTAKEADRSEVQKASAERYESVSADCLKNGHILKDDGTLRIVQCLGRRILSADEIDVDKYIPLSVKDSDAELNVEIYGAANIDGDISGDVKANGSINCTDIHGDAQAAGPINCCDINGDATAAGNITCNSIEGDVKATGGNIIYCK